jgi:SAM-dependent methyltransferase
VSTTALLRDPHRRRQRRQEHSDWRSRALVADLALPRDAKCLEIGAGLGSMARWLATVVAPAGEVLATEQRPDMVTNLAATGIGNLVAVHHDIESDPVPGTDYDLIYARFVFEHLADRSRLIADLGTRLRPGGWLVIEDAVLPRPQSDGSSGFDAALAAFAAGKHGSDYAWADRLPQLMRSCGLHPVRAQRVQDVFAAGSELALFWASVLVQELELRGAPADEDIVGELLTGDRWYDGPMIIQCAGRSGIDAGAGPRERTAPRTSELRKTRE